MQDPGIEGGSVLRGPDAPPDPAPPPSAAATPHTKAARTDAPPAPPESAPPAGLPPPVLAGLMVGTALEWYDFSVLAQLDGPLSAAFFPPHASAQVKALSFWLVYAAAFAVRPLGAIVFGAVGDTCGRKVTLVTTLLLMGASTTLVGCLPTHDQAGAAAPALLAALRICMGLSLGAEYTTAVVYAHEAARYRKGKAAGSAAVAAACALGSLGGLVVVMIVQAAAGAERMAAWGWRVPFLAALPIVAVALFLRLRMRESDVFVAAREARLLLQEGRGGAGGELSPAAGGVKAGTPKGADGGGPAAAGGAGPARKARRGAGPRCGPLAGAPLAQLLRRRWLAWCMDVAFVTWLASLLYVVYAWLPAALRSTGVMTPMLSYGMVMVSLAAEFGCILLGGWVAPRTRALALAAAGAPLASALCVGGAAAAGARSAGGAWAVQNAALGAGGLLLGVHAAAFVYIYPPEMRSTGFSLAYNTGCALGGASPAVVTALQMAAPHARLAGLIPGLWLLILSAPAAAAALALLALAPQADTCGRGEEEAGGGAPRGAAAAGAAALV